MAETTARGAFAGAATAEAVEAVHAELDRLWARAGHVPETDRAAFTLAVVEAATNVVVHAVPATEAPIRLRVDLVAGPRRLEARIYEIGAAPARVTLEPRMPQEQAESGRGLALIQALVSQVVFERHGDRNVWTLCRECGAGSP